MLEDKSEVNYPYEYTETETQQIKQPDYTKFKNSTGTHKFPISKHYVEKKYILKGSIALKINNATVSMEPHFARVWFSILGGRGMIVEIRRTVSGAEYWGR